jgi:hypothetical protein
MFIISAEARDARSHGESVMVVDHGDHSHLLLLGPDHPPTSAAFLGVFAFMIACQVGIFSWKRNRPHSFMLVTLVGLWVVPFLLSVSAGHTRFLLIWFLFSCSTAYITMRALKRPLEKNVPQLVHCSASTLPLLNSIHTDVTFCVSGLYLFLSDL